MSLTEIEWETVEENLGMLTDEALDRFFKRILWIKKERAITVLIREEAFR